MAIPIDLARSTGKYDDPFSLTPREKAYADCELYKRVIDQLAAGEMPAVIPWGEPRFRDMLLNLILAQRKYKIDSDKLAVVREVFGSR